MRESLAVNRRSSSHCWNEAEIGQHNREGMAMTTDTLVLFVLKNHKAMKCGLCGIRITVRSLILEIS